MKVKKIKVEFIENPKKAYMAKKPTIHWRPQARNLLQDLIKQGTITEVMHNTDFCVLANFVLKPGGENLRLVTDFRGIKKLQIWSGSLSLITKKIKELTINTSAWS